MNAPGQTPNYFLYLRMNRLTGSEEGDYLCEATNTAGRDEALATLIIQAPPSISVTPPGSSVVQAGQPLKLTCRVTGDPLPDAVWEKDGAASAYM